MGVNKILQRYVPDFERDNILAEAHGGVVRDHYAGKETARNIFRGGLWWPTLHNDSKAYCKVCDACKRIG